MGFFVDPVELHGRESQPALDYAPPLENGYRPSVNVHGNHANLGGYYDPRRHLPEHPILTGEDESLGHPRLRRQALLTGVLSGALLVSQAILWSLIGGYALGLLATLLSILTTFRVQKAHKPLSGQAAALVLSLSLLLGVAVGLVRVLVSSLT
jgi:hypothetical protein